MTEHKNLSEMIELHLELKAKSGISAGMPDEPESAASEAEVLLPPRSALFPSNRKKMTKIFYNTLLILFVLLVIGLTAWGIRLD